ncbi:protein FAR1-RELATED SEQUENCE 5-like [Prosopis cineraria]|uniref:protein FAR1-RELATED SEQUENCE 5-like n=1 Tax=Prosopis cineraria TaxID=364024 RepID=UPI00240F57F1|nr:protein FAR1-RELATED SEQUENCE 5-like [Prosopis cineraria]
MDINLTPRLNLEFDNIEDSWKFWQDCGRRTGFGVRKERFNKSKKDQSYLSYLYVCRKKGVRKPDKRDKYTKNPRPETRSVFLDHNHDLQPPEAVHMFPSFRELTSAQAFELETAEKDGINQKSSFKLMSEYAGGRTNLGYTRTDIKNYLNSKRQRAMSYGEAGCIFRYFEEQLVKNSSFFHAHQMDLEEQVTNVFWADARMLIDYAYFGEVISLDTTYYTNRDNRPLAIFSGINHYRGGVIFGAALLYDETIESFKWLFEIFLRAHKNVRPLTIFTDQDATMAHALQEVMPELASDASESLEAFSLVHEGILELTKRVDELCIKQKDTDGDGDGERNHKSNYVDRGNGGNSKAPLDCDMTSLEALQISQAFTNGSA